MLTENSDEQFHRIWQIHGDSIGCMLGEVFTQCIDLLADFAKVVMHSLLFAHDCLDIRGFAGRLPIFVRGTLQGFPPDVPQVSVFPTSPARSARFLDIET